MCNAQKIYVSAINTIIYRLMRLCVQRNKTEHSNRNLNISSDDISKMTVNAMNVNATQYVTTENMYMKMSVMPSYYMS